MANPLRKRPLAWPYRADPPQRYWGNYERYVGRGGRVDLEQDIRGFAAAENVGDISRFYFFSLAFDQIVKEGLAGDFAELGVYRGHTAALIATMARRLGRTAFLLDTFEGFDRADLRGIDADQNMQFADTSLAAVKAKVGEDNVRFIQGPFPGTADSVPETSYCLVHIDCDLYAPILSALRYFYPRLVPGGFLIVHDYSSMAWDGAERAVDEFFNDKQEPVIPLTDGAGSVVIRRARLPGSQFGWLDRKRLSLFSEDWTSAGKGGLDECLGEGWSASEDWGAWGIGPRHELKLYLEGPVTRDVFLDIDVHAPFVGEVREHVVGVLVQGIHLGDMSFTPAMNRGIRSIRIPCGLMPHVAIPCISVVFRPQKTVRPVEHNPAVRDTRELGLALHRIRRRAV